MDNVVFADGSGFLFGVDEGKTGTWSIDDFWGTVGTECFMVIFVFRGRIPRIGIRRNNIIMAGNNNNYLEL